MEAKERILLKADELFRRYGIRSVSMDDIAAQLGMSKKTLYQSYADKDELVNAVFEEVFLENERHCIESSKAGENVIHEVFLSFDKVQEMLSTMNPSVLFDMKKYHPTAFKKFQDFQNKFLFRMVQDNLVRGVAEGFYRDDFDVDIIVRYHISTIMLPFDAEIFPYNKTRLVEIEKQLMEHYLYGIVTARGQKLIQKYKNQRTKQ
jgi:AcrR family transcriptional regulator